MEQYLINKLSNNKVNNNKRLKNKTLFSIFRKYKD